MKKLAMGMAWMALAAAPGYGDTLKTDQIPSSARWIVHVDAEALMSSQLGAMLTKEILAKHAAQIEGLTTLIGMNPLKDVSGLTLYGEDAVRENAVAVLRGRFDKEKLLALAKLNPSYEKVDRGSFTVHKWRDQGKDACGCFFNDTTLVLGGSLERVGAALDALGGTGDRLDPASPLGRLGASAGGAFLLAAADGPGGMKGMKPEAAILKNARDAALVVREVEGELQAELTLTARDKESCDQMADVLRGLIAFGRLSGDRNPDLAKLAKSAKLTVENPQIRLNLSFPSADAMAAIKAGHEKRGKEPRAGRGHPPVK